MSDAKAFACKDLQEARFYARLFRDSMNYAEVRVVTNIDYVDIKQVPDAKYLVVAANTPFHLVRDDDDDGLDSGG